MKNYGNTLKEHRTNRNLSLQEVQKATGILLSNISRWERGEVIPSIYHCEILADFYGISLDELIGREFTYKE